MTPVLAVVLPEGYEGFREGFGEGFGEGFRGLATAVGVPAQQPVPPEDPGGQGEEFGKSSPIGLVIIILFFLAVGLLVRSMNKHLRRIPGSFDPPEETNDDPGTRNDRH